MNRPLWEIILYIMFIGACLAGTIYFLVASFNAMPY